MTVIDALRVDLVIFNRISSKFHIWIAFIKLSFKFDTFFSLSNDKQEGRKNGCRLSVSRTGHSN